MKYRVKKNRMITYPDGGLRGERGYTLDGAMWYERPTIEDFGDALERTERQAPVSPVDVERLMGSAPQKAPAENAPAKKKATKKKAKKKKVVRRVIDKLTNAEDDE